MVVGDRLRELREEKKLSQGDVEKRTGLLRCYISRVENGHTIPSLETMEKMAGALEVPIYKFFYDSEDPPALQKLPWYKATKDIAWGTSGEEAEFLSHLRRALERMKSSDRKLLLSFARGLASKRRAKKSIAA